MKKIIYSVCIVFFLVFVASLFIPGELCNKWLLSLDNVTLDFSKSVLSDSTKFLKITKEYVYFDSEYEEKIINKDDDDSVYKLIKTEVDGSNAYLLVVYDPSKVKIMTCRAFNTPNNTGKERVSDMIQRYGALAGVNGGGFWDNGEIATDQPIGYVIENNKILWGNKNRKANLIGMSNDNKLMLVNSTGDEAISQGMRDGLEFGPFIMVDGIVTDDAKKMGDKRASRVLMAQRKDGIMIFFVTDGGSYMGPRMNKVIEEIQKYGVYNVANLDGGASASLIVDGKMQNVAKNINGNLVPKGRMVVDGWGIFE